MDPVQANVHTPSYSSIFSTQFVPLVKERLDQVLSSDGSLAVILEHVLAANGKMLRPTLVSTVYQLFEEDNLNDCPELVDIGTGVELVHLASLIHDDIIDCSDMRRGLASVQKHFGAAAAVLSGDFLFAKAFALFTDHCQGDILKLMTDVICQMCEGEVQQLLAPGTDETYYWQYIYQKTGCLIEASCRAGAMLSSNHDQSSLDLIGKFGRYLGYGFQLIDDLLDYRESESSMGKNPGNDFHQGLWTLPVIRGVAHGILDPDWKNTTTFDQTRFLLAKHGVLREIELEAHQYLEQAKDILFQFPESLSRNQLLELTDFVGRRQH